jgi:hypothetical protein
LTAPQTVEWLKGDEFEAVRLTPDAVH